MPYVLHEWSAPETLINSLSNGGGVEPAVAETKASFADFLVKGGVPPAQAAQAADALIHRIIDSLAHGGSPETAIATAKEDIGGVIAHLVQAAQAEGPAGLDQALAQGDPQALARAAHELGVDGLPPAAQKAALTAWQSALANGADGAQAREAALDKAQGMVKALADGAVELSHGDSLAAHLAGGGPDAAAAIQAMTAGLPSAQAAALMSSLTNALAGGSQPSEALLGALAAARSAQATGDSQGVPMSQADMLVAALAGGGDVHAALAAAGLSGAAADSFLHALAGNAGSEAALSAAHEAQAAADQAMAQASAGVNGSALAAALASGGAEAAAALAGMSGSGAGQAAFISALGQALAGGASLESALQGAESNASQAAAVASATGSPLLAALASGQNSASALAAAGVSSGESGQAFAAALSSALASGASLEAAVQQANGAASAAESQVASSSSPVGSDGPAAPGPGGADQSPANSQSPPPAPAPGPETSSPASNGPPPVSVSEMLNPGGNNPPPSPPAPPAVFELPPVAPTPPPAALSDAASTPAGTEPVTIVAQSGPVMVTGHLIDGPIQGARVFVDANANGIYDPGEYSVITNGAGKFTIAADKLTQGQVTYDSTNPTGVDTQTLLPFKVAMTAPLGETNLTAFTNLIAAVMTKGYSEADATAKVALAVGASATDNLLTYDPSSAANQGSALAKTAANLLVVLSGVSSTITGSGVTSSSTTAMGAVIDALASQVVAADGTVDLANTSVIADVMAAAQTTVATAALADGGSSAGTIAIATAMQAKAVDGATLVDDYTNSQMVHIISDLVATISGAATPGDANAATQTALGDASTTLATIAGNQAATATDSSDAAASNLANSLSFAIDKFTGAGLLSTVATAKTDIANNQGSTTALSPPTAVADAPPFITQNEEVNIPVLANDHDPQGNTLSLVNIVQMNTASAHTQGTITANTDGTVTYDPGHVFDYLAAGQTVTDSFGYVVGNGTGQNATATVTVTIVGTNDAPVLATSGSTTFTEGGGANPVAPAVTLGDVDTATQASATVSVSSGFLAGDTLAATTDGTAISASYDGETGVLTLTGTDTLAHYQSVLQSVTFSSTSDNPTGYGNDTSRTIGFQTSDGQETNAASNVLNSTVAVVGVNDAPVLATSGSTTFTEGGGADPVASAVTVGDVDTLTQASASARISGGFLAGDILAATTDGTGISASYNGETGVLTLTGADTLAHYQSVLRSVTFSSSSDNPTDYGNDTSRTIGFQTSDGQEGNAASNLLNSTVAVVGVNDAPVLTTPGSTTFNQGGGANPVAPAITLGDVDTATQVSATVSISGGFLAGDTLAATTDGTAISASYDGETGVLTLTGTDTLAHYQSVLRSVSFSSTSTNPTDDGFDTSRTIGFQTSDGQNSNAASNVLNSTVAVTELTIAGSRDDGTGHYFRYYSTTGTISWGQAEANAENSSFMGASGHLAIITSSAENALVADLLDWHDAWLGGSRVNGVFKWVGTNTAIPLSNPEQGYSNWSSGEPNNSGGVENALEMYNSGALSGKWNDISGNSQIQAYVVEYDVPVIATAAFSADTGTAADFITNSATQTINGTLSSGLLAGEAVAVSLDGGATWSNAATTVGQNTWSLANQTLNDGLDGANTLEVKVTDGGLSGTVYSHTYTLDTTAPALSHASVNAGTLVLTYNETLAGSATPAAFDYTVHVGDTTDTVTAVAVDSTHKTVTLTLATPVTNSATVTVDYAGGEDAHPLQDAAGNAVAALAGGSVVNNTPAPNLIVNGSFETGDLTGWTQGGNTGYTYIVSDAAESGTYYLRAGPTEFDGTLSQTFSDTNGATMAVSFWLNGAGTPNDISVTINDNVIFSANNYSNSSWTHYIYAFTGTGNDTIYFSFRDDPSYINIDNIRVTQVLDPPLPPVAENTANPQGESVASLFSAAAPAQIVITADYAAADQGSWQYSTTGGASWVSLAGGGAPDVPLDPDSLLRFVPAENWSGTPGSLLVGLIASPGEAIASYEEVSTSVTAEPRLADDRALGFDGSSHVDVANTAPLQPTAALTLEAWVQLSAAGGSIIDDLSGNAGYKLGVDAGGHLQFTIGNGTDTTTVTGSGASLVDGGWHQVAASYDGSALHLYVDDAKVADLTGVSGNALGASAFSDLILGKGLNGALNDIRLWSSANSQAQIVQDMSHALNGNEDGLAGYWKFDEQSGTSFANSVSGAHYGTGTACGSPGFIDLMSQSASTDIIAAMNASSYKGMILASAANGDSLSYAVDTNGAPAHGAVDFHNNAFVYLPTSGHISQDDSFTVDIIDNATHIMKAHTVTIHPA